MWRSIAIVAGLGLVTIACEREELSSQDQAMRLGVPQLVADDLPLASLIAGLEEQTKWLDRTDRRMEFGPVTINGSLYAEGLNAFIDFLRSAPSSASINDYISENFEWYEVYGRNDWREVKLTSYYLPLIEGSVTKTERFNTPFLARPQDLLQVMTRSYWDPVKEIGTMRGRIDPKDQRKIIPFFSRAEIENGVLADRGLELVWSKIGPPKLIFLISNPEIKSSKL
jgi:membrane-bound lytic murein transglycosylase A